MYRNLEQFAYVRLAQTHPKYMYVEVIVFLMDLNCRQLKQIFVASSIAVSVMVLCSLHLVWCNTTVCCLPQGVPSSSRTSDHSKGRRQHSNGGWLFTTA